MDKAVDPRRAQELVNALRRTLGISMGIRILPGKPSTQLKPAVLIALWLLIYSLVVGSVLVLAPHPVQGQDRITALLVWFGLYFAAALYLTSSSTRKIFDTVENDIIPYSTDDYLAAVASDLDHHFTRWRRIALPLLIAAVSVSAAIWMFSRDIESKGTAPLALESPQMLLWSASYFLCFYAAAAGVVGAQFHIFFAKNLQKASRRFSVMGASETPIVQGLAKLGTQVLIFWVLIFLAIASIMLLVITPDPYKLPSTSRLLSTMVPISLFFSLGFGTLVYLASESAIRAALKRFTGSHAAALQERMNEILSPAEGSVPPDAAELDRLLIWHDRVIAGGHYGSRIGATVSIALPLIMPVVTLILSQFS